MRLKLLIFTSLCVFSGCTVQPSEGAKAGLIVSYTRCQLPADQGQGSFQGAWGGLPIPVVLDKDFYVTDEGETMDAMRGALETWNGWSRLRGMEAFNILDDGSGADGGREIPEIAGCDQAAYSSAVTDAVGIWKISSHGHRKNARSTCGASLKILPDGVQGQTDWIVENKQIVGSSILLNFEGFNAPGMRLIDVESLLLHELGHVLGLLHSCNGSTSGSIDSTAAPACDFAPPNYKEAVMFPGLDEEQERRDLKQNDYNRINCIY